MVISHSYVSLPEGKWDEPPSIQQIKTSGPLGFEF
jgi:hypothetical protein